MLFIKTEINILIMDDTEFEKVIEEAIKELPEEFSEKIENVSVTLADWPDANQVSVLGNRADHRLLLGLYQGTPKTRRGSYGVGGHLPDKITLFKNPLRMISKTRENLIENIKNTLIHEIAHHFGMSEEAIRSTSIG